MKLFHHVHGSILPRDKRRYLVTVNYSKTNHLFDVFALSCNFWGVEDPPQTLLDMVRASIYVWDRRKLVAEDGKNDTQNLETHAHVNTVCSAAMVCKPSVTNDA